MESQDFLKRMGKRIAIRRKLLGLTQEQVAEAMDVSVQMISNLEQGKKAIRPENLAKISSVLRVSSDYILTGASTLQMGEDLSKKITSLSKHDYEMITLLADHFLWRDE